MLLADADFCRHLLFRHYNITKKKFIKLLIEVYFYNIVLWCIFFFTGYEAFSVKGFLKMIFPFFTVADNFTSCFLLFLSLIHI